MGRGLPSIKNRQFFTFFCSKPSKTSSFSRFSFPNFQNPDGFHVFLAKIAKNPWFLTYMRPKSSRTRIFSHVVPKLPEDPTFFTSFVPNISPTQIFHMFLFPVRPTSGLFAIFLQNDFKSEVFFQMLYPNSIEHPRFCTARSPQSTLLGGTVCLPRYRALLCRYKMFCCNAAAKAVVLITLHTREGHICSGRATGTIWPECDVGYFCALKFVDRVCVSWPHGVVGDLVARHVHIRYGIDAKDLLRLGLHHQLFLS